MHNQPDILIFPDVPALQQAAAERVVLAAQERVAAAHMFVCGLSGGSTPRGLYQLLAQEPLRSQMPWAHTYVLWNDERYVPPDHLDSNYLLARETLLDHVPIPPEQIYPIPTYYDDPREAAAAYEQQMRRLLELSQARIDLMLMGMGPDGHTASLFPGHPELNTPDDVLVVAVENAPKPPPRRISLTAAAINTSAQVLFLVTGADKAETLQAVLHGPYEPHRLPAQLIRPSNGTTTWLVDAAAGTRVAAAT